MRNPRDDTPLGYHLDKRRQELQLSWEEVADRVGVTTGHLRRIRKGLARFSAPVEARLEDVMGWQPGSIREIMKGGRPTLRAPQPAGQLAIELVDLGDGSTVTVPVPPGLSKHARSIVVEQARKIAEQLAGIEGLRHTRH